MCDQGGEGAGVRCGGEDRAILVDATDGVPMSESVAKDSRFQNIVPVSVKQLLECQGDVVKMEGFESQVITLVGLVRRVEKSFATSKVSVYIEDQTGTIECVSYGSSDESKIEGTYRRIVGALRTNEKGRKYVNVIRNDAITDLNEITSHLLEVLNTPFKLKELRAVEDSKLVEGGEDEALETTFESSMILGRTGMGAPEASLPGFSLLQSMVLRVISNPKDVSVGVHLDDIIYAVKHRMGLGELMSILDFLIDEGHVLYTEDGDHYKVADSVKMEA